MDDIRLQNKVRLEQAVLDIIGLLREMKPGEASELSRRYAIAITMCEQLFAWIHSMLA